MAEETWLQEKQKETNQQTERGHVHKPALLFAFATLWMLREIELALVMKEDIQIQEDNRIASLYLRCKGECSIANPCPFAISKEALDDMSIEDTQVAHLLSDGIEATKDDIIKSWRLIFGKKVSGHSARRSGALQYIRKSWRVPQVAFLGRWKSNVILQYAEEALATTPVMANQTAALPSTLAPRLPEGNEGERLTKEEKIHNIIDLKETKEQCLKHAKNLKREVETLKAAQEKLEALVKQWDEVAAQNRKTISPIAIFTVCKMSNRFVSFPAKTVIVVLINMVQSGPGLVKT